MTDEQIMKALECCTSESFVCSGCPYYTLEAQGVEYTEYDCSWYLRRDAFELIKRQQEDIELLKIDNGLMTTKSFEMAMNKAVADKVRAEAIKEFEDKLKANIGDEDFYVQDKLLLMSMIESLAKEMGCGE